MCSRGMAVLLLAGLSATAQAPLEKEAALGKQLAAEVRRSTTAMDNPLVQKYLDQLGKKLAAQIPEASFPFTFSAVVEDPCRTTHQPAALPGGYVFVPAALFLAAQDEAEFAGVLARAMEYTQQRPATRSTVAYGSSIPLVFIGGWSGACSDAFAIPGAWVASERRAESAADVLAVQAMARAGFDPAGAGPLCRENRVPTIRPRRAGGCPFGGD